LIAPAIATITVHGSPVAAQSAHTPTPSLNPAAAYCTGGDIVATENHGATYIPECGGSYTSISGGLYSAASSYVNCLKACDNNPNNCVSFSFLLTASTSNCYMIYDPSAALVTDPNVDSGTVLV